MKVLVLAKYGLRAASPRHRFLAFAPYLEKQGIHLVFEPLFDDSYLASRLTSGELDRKALLRSYLRRVTAMLGSSRYDLLWIHCELFPYLPAWIEQLLARAGVRYVFDYDDAIFHMYDQHPNGWVRRALGDKIGRVIEGAQAVTAGSQYLVEYARRYQSNVHLVPTVVALERYAVEPGDRDGRFTVGWIGSPSTARFLSELREPLAALAREIPLKVLLIGSGPMEVPDVDLEVREWSEDREAADLAECDVGVMPLPDAPWARGKCAFKLIQYMAAGLPTVGSPVGANRDVVTEQTGWMASSPEEWKTALRRLAEDPELRRRLGAAGRARAKERYSLTSQEPRVKRILSEAGGA
ncbi:MAG: glycosyltransferase family 4 protein [Myxococcota bacterium]